MAACSRALFSSILLVACSSGPALPPAAPLSPMRALEVPRPPPAAMPETLPKPPQAPGDWVWIDGSWRYGLGRWVWHRGGWVTRPADAFYFRGSVAHTADGRILFWEPTWVDAEGRVTEAPEIEKPALTPRAERSVEGLF
jgi:hypothetical protein